jgi:uncharacterized membrane protein YdjX (TVP38/TMEM64 family)
MPHCAESREGTSRGALSAHPPCRSGKAVTDPGPSASPWRVAVLAAAVLLVTALLWRLGLLDVSRMRDVAAEAGPAAPVLFVLGYAGLTLVPAPKNLLSALGGALFGLGTGLVVVWVAAMVGALTAFLIARGLGVRAVAWLSGRHRTRAQMLLERHGLASVVAVRLVPVAPFTVVNYAAGLAGVRTRDYVLGTGVGIVPGTLAYVAAGAYALQSPWRMAVAGAALLLLVLVGGHWARRLARGSTGQE